jgi:hypothetical protein
MNARLSSLWLIVMVGAAAIILAVLRLPSAAAAGWLIAFFLVSAVPIGSLAWLMIQELTGGRWIARLRPGFASAAATLPVLLLAAVPAFAAMSITYPWVRDSSVFKADVTTAYLNPPFFVVRTILAFVGWSVLFLLLRRSGPRLAPLVAATGLVFHAVMMTFWPVDWVLSADPRFISTSFGATIAVMQLLAALDFIALFGPGLDRQTCRDLAGLILAVTLGITYLNFMSLLVIWYGDLPSKVFWFSERSSVAWLATAMAFFIFGGLIPVLALLFSRVRESRLALRLVAGCSLVGIALFVAWLFAPRQGPVALVMAASVTVGLATLLLIIGTHYQQRWTLRQATT